MYSKIVESTHLWLPRGELKRPVHELRTFFTIRSSFDVRKAVALYKEAVASGVPYVGIPRYYKPELRDLAEEYIDKTSHGLPVSFRFTSELRERQQPMIDAFVQALAQGKTGFLLHAPTGSGKTVLLLKMLEILGKTALVIVPRDYIVQQWRERILEHTDLTASDIGLAQQRVCDFEGKKIVIGMIHSLSKGKYPVEFRRYFGVVVWDECHVLGAETFAKTVGMFPARYRIGASATPSRRDGMDEVFRWSIAETTLQMAGSTEVLPKVLVRNYSGVIPPQRLGLFSDKMQRRGVIITAIARDFKRNVLIAAYLKKLADSGRRVLLLSDRKEQLETVYSLLTVRHKVLAKDVGIFTHETPKRQREDILRYAKIILATYGVMSMAVDVPDLAGLVFGTPLSDVIQPVGRILRRAEDKKEPVVIDIVDTAFRECRAWYARRLVQYQKSGAQVIQIAA